MPKSCAISNCKTGSKGFEGKRSLFRVPTDPEKRKKWENAIPGNKKLKDSQSICERHFSQKHVFKKWIKYDDGGNIVAQMNYPRARLHSLAIPCIFDDDIPPEPVDAWAAYRQQKYGYEHEPVTIKLETYEEKSETLEEPLEGPPTKILNPVNKLQNNKIQIEIPQKFVKALPHETKRWICSTEEHSYCRSTLNDHENYIAMKNISPSIENVSNNNSTSCNINFISSPLTREFTTTIKAEPNNVMNLEQDVHVAIRNNEKIPIASDEMSETNKLKYKKSLLTTSQVHSYDEKKITVVPDDDSHQIKLKYPDINIKLEESISLDHLVDVEEFEPIDEIETVNPETRPTPIKVDTGGVFEQESGLVRLPYMWGVNEVMTAQGKQIIFSHTVLMTRNGVDVPVLKKSVKVHERSGKIEYYAHGKLLDVSETKLPQNSLDVKSFQITLYTFQKMRVCGGIALINKPTHKDTYQDNLEYWRHIRCKLLVSRGKCDHCLKLQKLLSQKRRRAAKNQGSHRISSSLEPSEQIVLLRKKIALERRKRIAAQAQAKRLSEASKENAVRVKFVENMTL